MMSVTQITSLDQYVQVTERHTVSVVQFSSSRQTCQKMAKVFASYAERYSAIDFYVVDSQANREIALNAGILAYPTVVIFEGGEDLDAIVGPKPRDLERTLKLFSPSPPTSPGFHWEPSSQNLSF